MYKMIKAEYQKWENGNLVHEYKPFYREKALIEDSKAVERYDFVLQKFMRETPQTRKKGLIFGGVEYDFDLQEVE